MPGINQANKPHTAIKNISVALLLKIEAILSTQQIIPPAIMGLNFKIPPVINVGKPNNIIIKDASLSLPILPE